MRGTPAHASQYDRQFAVRVVALDYHYAPPKPGLDPTVVPSTGTEIKKVCVVRVFGSTLSGQPTCLHVHQVFPYFYVRCGHVLPSSAAGIKLFIANFEAALNGVLDRLAGAAHGGDDVPAPQPQQYAPQYQEGAGHDPDGTTANGKTGQHVFAVTLVKATCFYGYNAAPEPFLRVCLFRPSAVAKAADAIVSGAVLGLKLQPYEAHIPYLLQFKIDMNVYGMGHLVCRAVQFRKDPPMHPGHQPPAGWRHTQTQPVARTVTDAPGATQGKLRVDAAPWTAASTPYSWTAASRGGGAHAAVSSCALEADCLVSDVLNRQDAVRVSIAEAAESDRLVESLASIWQEETARIGGPPPQPPPSPRRQPQDVCAMMTAARADFSRTLQEVARYNSQRRTQGSGDKRPASFTPSGSHADLLPSLSPATMVSDVHTLVFGELPQSQSEGRRSSGAGASQPHTQPTVPKPPAQRPPSSDGVTSPHPFAIGALPAPAVMSPTFERLDAPMSPPRLDLSAFEVVPQPPSFAAHPPQPDNTGGNAALSEVADQPTASARIEQPPGKRTASNELQTPAAPRSGSRPPDATPCASRALFSGHGLSSALGSQVAQLASQALQDAQRATPETRAADAEAHPASQAPSQGASHVAAELLQASQQIWAEDRVGMAALGAWEADAVRGAFEQSAKISNSSALQQADDVAAAAAAAVEAQYLQEAADILAGIAPAPAAGARGDSDAARASPAAELGEASASDCEAPDAAATELPARVESPDDSRMRGAGDPFDAEVAEHTHRESMSGSDAEQPVASGAPLLHGWPPPAPRAADPVTRHGPESPQLLLSPARPPSGQASPRVRSGSPAALPAPRSYGALPLSPNSLRQAPAALTQSASPVAAVPVGPRAEHETDQPSSRRPMLGWPARQEAQPTCSLSSAWPAPATSTLRPVARPAPAPGWPPMGPPAALWPSPSGNAEHPAAPAPSAWSPLAVQGFGATKASAAPSPGSASPWRPGQLHGHEAHSREATGVGRVVNPTGSLQAAPAAPVRVQRDLQASSPPQTARPPVSALAALSPARKATGKSLQCDAPEAPKASHAADGRATETLSAESADASDTGVPRAPVSAALPAPQPTAARLAVRPTAEVMCAAGDALSTDAARARSSQAAEQPAPTPEQSSARVCCASAAHAEATTESKAMCRDQPGHQPPRVPPCGGSETAVAIGKAEHVTALQSNTHDADGSGDAQAAAARTTAASVALVSQQPVPQPGACVPEASQAHVAQLDARGHNATPPPPSSMHVGSHGTRDVPQLKQHASGSAASQWRPALLRLATRSAVATRAELRQGTWRVCKHAPPRLAELASSRSHRGVTEQEHVSAYYDVDDASRKATEFANEIFTLPTDSIRELPSFHPAEGRLAVRVKHHRLEQPRGGATWHEFAKPPPRLGTSAPGGNAAPGSHGATPMADFRMNPNTGALIPVHHPLQNAHVSQGSAGRSQHSLLGTPLVPLPAALSAGAATPAGLASATQLLGRRASLAIRTNPVGGAVRDEADIRPPSPKYDERAGGYFTAHHSTSPLGPRSVRSTPRSVMPARSPAVQQLTPSVRTSDAAGASTCPVTAAQKQPAGKAFRSTPQQPRRSFDGVDGRSAVPRLSIQTAAGQMGGKDRARTDSEESDVPSPKWDETTCFFTKPARRRSRQSAATPAIATARSSFDGGLRPPAAATGAAQATRPRVATQSVGPEAAPEVRSTASALDAASHNVLTGQKKGRSAAAVPDATRPTGNAAHALRASLGNSAATSASPDGALQAASTPQTTAAATAPPRSCGSFRTVVPGKGHQLTIASLEVLAACRGKLLPDPKYDAVLAVALAVWYDHEDVEDTQYECRVLLNTVDAGVATAFTGAAAPAEVQVDRLSGEAEVLQALVDALKTLDPDIVVAFDLMRGSIGYLEARARELGVSPPLLRQIGRCPQSPGVKEMYNDAYGETTAHNLHTSGRILLNIWRAMTTELKLAIYNAEACFAAVLQMRVPEVPAHVAAGWFRSSSQWRALRHVCSRARLNLALLDALDLVNRTAELAKTFGIDWYSVISRGSQYRVESMLARLAHTQNFLLIAPTREQVGGQPAMEALPLVMEPESRFYHEPVLVLDFQSLYPSIVIAYNLCFSTCLGSPDHCSPRSADPLRLGVYRYKADPAQVELSVDDLRIAGNGVAFVAPHIRKGVLPRLLREILETRVMVKGALKTTKRDKVMQRTLNARQFALKLIANVTYGYTAAGFSGRMPMAELADAIVGTGRATLESAISHVNNHPSWGARVVYGDTDSLFVLLPGRSKESAFTIGNEIATAITTMNPSPIKLKFEKVYMGSILQTKKRYVGNMFEEVRQAEAALDTKGIEIVRRDSCPAVAKILTRSLVTLFERRSLTEVREYVQRQFMRILANRVSLQDFMFAREVRLGSYRTATVPPAALVAAKCMAQDPRMEPARGERIRFVVVHGQPGARLVDCVVHPHAVIAAAGRLQLNGQYYIVKQILPALDRLFSLLGVDVTAWFAEMAKPQRLLPQKRALTSLPLQDNSAAVAAASLSMTTIDQFYASRHCIVCDGLTPAKQPICDLCLQAPQLTTAVLKARMVRLQKQVAHFVLLCNHCGGGGGFPGDAVDIEDSHIVCKSLECGVYFERAKTQHELYNMRALSRVAMRLLSGPE